MLREKPPPGQEDGFSVLSSAGYLDYSENRPPRPNTQAETAQNMRENRAPHLRLVEPPRPPLPRRLEVQIAVADGRAPIGRSRLFRLYPQDIERLIDAFERLEALS
jgi:hypothetical protein